MNKLVNLLQTNDALLNNPLRTTEKRTISKADTTDPDIINNFLINSSIDTKSTQK